MSDTIEFTVAGVPAPQGSKRGFVRGTRVVMVESSSRLMPYRAAVAAEARFAWPHPPLTESVTLDVVFTFVRPRSHLNKIGVARPSAPPSPARPDLDKLLRAIGDAMTGIIYRDDSQISSITATKAYGETAETSIHIGIDTPYA